MKMKENIIIRLERENEYHVVENFEGNIDFYGKSGFRQASEFGIRYHGLPEGEDASFFLCKELIPGYLNGITGEYAPPAGYLVNEKEAEAFDREFLYMEKKKLLGQIFE